MGKVKKIEYSSINQDLIDSIKLPVGYLKARRLFDFILIILILPSGILLSAIAIILIKLSGRGPILFKQSRHGKNGKLFDFYKFRTMRPIQESEMSHSYHEECRVIRFGKFLRKFRIDEIPQLWNVVKGDMSIIGPRPELDLYYLECIKEIPSYSQRKIIEPGLTGLAQVNFNHTDTIEGAKTKLEYDIYYLKNLSPVLDIFIVIKTIFVLIFGWGGR